MEEKITAGAQAKSLGKLCLTLSSRYLAHLSASGQQRIGWDGLAGSFLGFVILCLLIERQRPLGNNFFRNKAWDLECK